MRNPNGVPFVPHLQTRKGHKYRGFKLGIKRNFLISLVFLFGIMHLRGAFKPRLTLIHEASYRIFLDFFHDIRFKMCSSDQQLTSL